MFQSEVSDVIINCDVTSNYMSSSNDYSGIINDQEKIFEEQYDEEVTEDNMPFKSKGEFIIGTKHIAKIKNNQAARKYRAKRRQQEESLEKQLHDVDEQKNKL